MSSAVLDVAASVTEGVPSIMIRLNQVVSIKLEDYTVPRCIQRSRRNARLLYRKEIVPGKKTRKAAASAPQTKWADHFRYFFERQDRMVETICELVRIESPSDNKAAVDGIARFLAAKFESLRGPVRLHHTNNFA